MSTVRRPADNPQDVQSSPSLVVSTFQVRTRALRRAMIGGYQTLSGIVVALFWLRSGLAHITNPYYFLSSIYSYEIVGPAVGVVASVGLPALQLILAAALVSRRFVGGALLLSSVLLGSFTAAQATALGRGLEINCGCFGAATQQPIGGESLVTAGLLFVLAVSAFVCWSLGQDGRGTMRAPVDDASGRGSRAGAPAYKS